MIHGHWCTHFEVSVRTFQGVYANCIKIGNHTQIRTQNRIQLFVPILRFLLLFRGIFALSRHKKHIFDRRSQSSESFCAFGGWAFLFALNLWVIVKIMVLCNRDGKLPSVFCDGLRGLKSTSKIHPPCASLFSIKFDPVFLHHLY